MKLRKNGVAIIAMVVFLAGCSGMQLDHTANWNAHQLYQAGKTEMESSSYTTAIDYFTKLLARYPYGVLAQQSMLDIAYSYYRAGEAEKALAQLDSFSKTYPQHPYIDYALYMKGVVEYEKNISFFKRLLPTDLSQTDPTPLKNAFDLFAQLVERFPQSEYAEDARYRMIFLHNLLGKHDLEIADFYLRKGDFVAAAARAKNILEHYETTPSAPYALAIMIRAYRELGQKLLADDAMRVFNMNYVDSLESPEIKRYLQGNIHKQANFFDRIRGSSIKKL